MITEPRTMQDDALIMVHVRNDFYRRKYYFVLGIYLLSIVMNLGLLAIIIFLFTHPTHPIYFATDKVGRLIKDVPVTEPNMSTQEATAWAIEAVQAAYSYNYVNYRAQLQNAQKYFTEYGWRNYMDGLQASDNLLALTQRKYVIMAKVVNPPKVMAEGILSGAYAWKFQMPLLVTYLPPPYDGKGQFSNALMLTVVVQRQSLLQSYKGLGVLQMIATFA